MTASMVLLLVIFYQGHMQMSEVYFASVDTCTTAEKQVDGAHIPGMTAMCLQTGAVR